MQMIPRCKAPYSEPSVWYKQREREEKNWLNCGNYHY